MRSPRVPVVLATAALAVATGCTTPSEPTAGPSTDPTGPAGIAATPGPLPVDPAPAPVDPVTVPAPDGGEVLADRVVLRAAPDATAEQVQAAAAAVGGGVVGRLSSHAWQVDLPPVATWAELAALLDALEGTPGLLDVQPVAVGTLDGVDG